VISLDRNEIGSVGAQFLLDAFMNNTVLQYFDIPHMLNFYMDPLVDTGKIEHE